MKFQLINGTTAVDMGSKTPFGRGFNPGVVAMNGTAGALVLEESDDGTTGWTTVASLGAWPTATAVAQAPITKRYLRCQTAGVIYVFSTSL